MEAATRRASLYPEFWGILKCYFFTFFFINYNFEMTL